MSEPVSRGFARLIKPDGHEAPRAITHGHISLGHERLDRQLNGGLACGRLHEFFAAEQGDAATVSGFAAMLAQRVQSPGSELLWLGCGERPGRSRLYPPGLRELGLGPEKLVVAYPRSIPLLLRAACDAASSAGAPILIVECWGNQRALDLTATRRLALSAEKSGTTILMLRVDATPAPSAAETRWLIRSAPSTPLEANAPGMPAIDLELLRHRAGPAGLRWHLEWDRDQQSFRQASLSGGVPAAAAGRTDQAVERRTG